MKRQHGVTSKNGVRPRQQDRLHELIATGSWNVVKAIQPMRDMLEAAPLVELAEFNSGDAKFLSVARRDVAVLVQTAFVEATTIILPTGHLASVAKSVPFTVRSCQ